MMASFSAPGGHSGAVAGQRRDEKQRQRGIVVRRDVAVDERGGRRALDGGDLLRIEIMRRGGAGAHDVGEGVVSVADEVAVGRGLPIFGLGVVCEHPGAAGVDALQHDAEAGLQVLAIELARADDRREFALQRLGVEFGMQAGQAGLVLAEDARPMVR